MANMSAGPSNITLTIRKRSRPRNAGAAALIAARTKKKRTAGGLMLINPRKSSPIDKTMSVDAVVGFITSFCPARFQRMRSQTLDRLEAQEGFGFFNR
jgi:hypothetical protein